MKRRAGVPNNKRIKRLKSGQFAVKDMKVGKKKANSK